MSLADNQTTTLSKSVTLRVTADEHRQMMEHADHHGLTLSAYIRLRALGQNLPKRRRSSSCDEEHVALILACLGQIKQVVDEYHTSDKQSDMLGTVMITRALLQARDHCFEALGRKA